MDTISLQPERVRWLFSSITLLLRQIVRQKRTSQLSEILTTFLFTRLERITVWLTSTSRCSSFSSVRIFRRASLTMHARLNLSWLSLRWQIHSLSWTLALRSNRRRLMLWTSVIKKDFSWIALIREKFYRALLKIWSSFSSIPSTLGCLS